MDGVMKSKEYNEYYVKMLDEATEFQDFVCIELIKRGIVLSNMSSKKYQNLKGENVQGFEIKFDKIYETSGNLYIEFAEKSNPNNEHYVASGIYRNDNSWIYAAGNYDGIYLMQKKVLRAMHKKGNYIEKENKYKTSKGFLLPNKIDQKIADKYFDYIKF